MYTNKEIFQVMPVIHDGKCGYRAMAAIAGVEVKTIIQNFIALEDSLSMPSAGQQRSRLLRLNMIACNYDMNQALESSAWLNHDLSKIILLPRLFNSIFCNSGRICSCA